MNKNTQPPLIVLVLTLLPVGYLLYAALNVAGGKPPWETLSLAGLNYTLVGGLLIVAAAVVGILAYASARIKKPYEPIWAPLHSSQVSKAFCRHIERNSVPAIDAGYIPMGLYLAQKAFLGQIESFCLLHPQGHSAMRITQFSPVKAIEIQSFLDDGSVIESSNASESAVGHAFDLFSEAGNHGFFFNLFPDATPEALVEQHNNCVSAALTDPNVGLRKQTTENWREYACYARRHFDQIKFDLGKLTEPPQPFTFPTGELVRNESGQRPQEETHETGVA